MQSLTTYDDIIKEMLYFFGKVVKAQFRYDLLLILVLAFTKQ
jgi:hypothetical protein